MKHKVKYIPIPPYERITHEFCQRKFYEYNHLYFEGKLPTCRFYFNYMNALGLYFGSDEPEIWINILLTYDEDYLIRDVIIHEMIHCYIHKVQKKTEKTIHGPIFAKIRNKLNKKYRLGISNCRGFYKYTKDILAYDIYAVEYEPQNIKETEDM